MFTQTRDRVSFDAVEFGQQVDQAPKKEEKLVFTELRSCCGNLYGYMDQHGREYDLNKRLKA